MRPRVIVHNSVSIDGATGGFALDLDAHFGALGELEADGFLVEAAVALASIDADAPDETDQDGAPRLGASGAVWFVVDDKGELENKLHVIRRYEIRDVVVLGTASTPRSYRRWLAARSYAFHEVGKDAIDFAQALDTVHDEYGVTRLVTDGRSALVQALLAADVVDELSLLVFPNLVAASPTRLFDGLAADVQLDLEDAWALENGAIHLRWTVRRS